ncbi:MAG: serine/threonine protein kinase [Deltaproteobacteria bacterium]|nr:serine/threonine protein kinase [Deltaproteobacteria bacterium]
MGWVCEECGQRFAQGGHCTADGNALAQTDDPLLGETIGNFRITRLLGAGGMGRVYGALQPAIHARVAIKVLSLDTAQNRDLVDRFFAEARAVNLIRHESIVNVTDLSRLPDGRPYIVMEYLDGAPLSSLLRTRGALPLGTTVTLIGEVLDALAAAHAKGIVHRDLKPDNIFVTPGGRAKVLDFGIAKLSPELSGMSAPTHANSILGTPPYMSPEQAAGKPVDARSDLYSIGVILYEMVTGTRPFVSDALFDLLRMHIMEPPTPPSARRPDLPPAFEAVILHALAKEPAQRVQSAHELAGALAQAVHGLPPEQWVSLRMTAGVPTPAHVTGRAFVPTAPAGQTPGGPPPVAPTAAAPRPSAPLPVPTGPSRRVLFAAIGVAVIALGAVVFLLAGRGARGSANPSRSPGATPSTAKLTPTPSPGAAPRFDPRAVDLLAIAAEASRLANQKVGVDDFVPSGIVAHNVAPSGLADLTIGKEAFIMVDLLSEKMRQRPATLPTGVAYDGLCGFRIYFWPGRGFDVRGPATCRDDLALGPLKCTPSRIWQVAIGAGAPRDGVARMLIERSSEEDGVRWQVWVGEAFHVGLADNYCGPAVQTY